MFYSSPGEPQLSSPHKRKKENMSQHMNTLGTLVKQMTIVKAKL